MISPSTQDVIMGQPVLFLQPQIIILQSTGNPTPTYLYQFVDPNFVKHGDKLDGFQPQSPKIVIDEKKLLDVQSFANQEPLSNYGNDIQEFQ